MFKKAVIVACLAVAPVGLAHACITQYAANENEVERALEGGWGFKNYDIVCKKLEKANASFNISASITVLGGIAISWASVGIKDRDLNIFADDFGGLSTLTNSTASMDVARRNLPVVISNAVDTMNVDKAIAALNDARKEVKAAYRK